MDLEGLEKFRDWIPAGCEWKGDRAFVDWCFLGKERLIEPFFDDSIQKRFRRPFNLTFRHQTPFEFLGELYERSKGIKPTGFIFHLSRCGSTLVSQMLAALPQNIVISEASPIDFALRSGNLPDESRIDRLRWVINALGQRRNAAEENYFIKFDSWNALEIDLVRRAYPEVPWIFLYREPVEIIVSHMRQRGAHMVPGLLTSISPELSFEESVKMPPEEYCAIILGKICRSVLEPLKNRSGLAINYTELPGAVEEKFLKRCDLNLPEKDLLKMLSATKNNAKNPVLEFIPDSAQKKKEASKIAIAAAEKFVNPFYAELEAIRKHS